MNDDAKQSKAAITLLSKKQTYTAPPTVILELVWVLRVNGCEREQIIRALKLLLGLPNFKPKQFEAICYAMRWYEEGMDFGDALHLALSAGDQAFCTFDKALSKIASESGALPAVRLVS
ncbi:MAG: type II toxin-antitoxin system VapC family toxin [Hydrogenophilales bacterium]|nr:type II toxin-antitoxin system VapC family toxin [Hydrogenophilales bacterium]